MRAEGKGFIAIASCILFNAIFAFAFFWTMSNRVQEISSLATFYRFFAFIAGAAGIAAIIWTYVNNKKN